MFYSQKLAAALTQAIALKGVSDRAVARAFGVKPPSVSQWKISGRIHKKHIPQLLSYFGDVVGPDHWGLEAQTEAKTGYISFDLLDVEAAAGTGIQPVDYPEVLERINVLESWAITALGKDLSKIRLITARGISMRGTIENGDVLFVDSSVRAYDADGIYIILRGQDILVKRLEKLHGNKLAIISDNQQSRSEELNEQEANEVIICGRVLASWSLKQFW